MPKPVAREASNIRLPIRIAAGLPTEACSTSAILWSTLAICGRRWRIARWRSRRLSTLGEALRLEETPGFPYAVKRFPRLRERHEGLGGRILRRLVLRQGGLVLHVIRVLFVLIVARVLGRVIVLVESLFVLGVLLPFVRVVIRLAKLLLHIVGVPRHR